MLSSIGSELIKTGQAVEIGHLSKHPQQFERNPKSTPGPISVVLCQTAYFGTLVLHLEL